MRRLWLGAALLLSFLVFGLLLSQSAHRAHHRISRELSAAARAAQARDWDRAEASFSRAKALWERRRWINAVTADHGPMEQADSLFARGECWLRLRLSGPFSGECARLAFLTRAVGDAQRLSWQNLL